MSQASSASPLGMHHTNTLQFLGKEEDEPDDEDGDDTEESNSLNTGEQQPRGGGTKQKGVELIKAIINTSKAKCRQMFMNKARQIDPRKRVNNMSRNERNDEETMSTIAEQASMHAGQPITQQEVDAETAVIYLQERMKLIKNALTLLEDDEEFGKNEDEDRAYYTTMMDDIEQSWVADFDLLVDEPVVTQKPSKKKVDAKKGGGDGMSQGDVRFFKDLRTLTERMEEFTLDIQNKIKSAITNGGFYGAMGVVVNSSVTADITTNVMFQAYEKKVKDLLVGKDDTQTFWVARITKVLKTIGESGKFEELGQQMKSAVWGGDDDTVITEVLAAAMEKLSCGIDENKEANTSRSLRVATEHQKAIMVFKDAWRLEQGSIASTWHNIISNLSAADKTFINSKDILGPDNKKVTSRMSYGGPIAERNLTLNQRLAIVQGWNDEIRRLAENEEKVLSLDNLVRPGGNAPGNSAKDVQDDQLKPPSLEWMNIAKDAKGRFTIRSHHACRLQTHEYLEDIMEALEDKYGRKVELVQNEDWDPKKVVNTDCQRNKYFRKVHDTTSKYYCSYCGFNTSHCDGGCKAMLKLKLRDDKLPYNVYWKVKPVGNKA
jgi:hypothetical protein